MKATALAAAFLALLLLSGAPRAGFELRSLSVTVNINTDGSAHVEENAQIFITSTSSRELYEGSFVYNDLSTWRDRLGIDEIRQHVSRASVDIARFGIRPQPPGRCNSFAGTCFASIVYDYDVAPSANSSNPGLVRLFNYKPRTTLYSLNPQALSFETTKSGDIILSKQTTLTVSVPQDAKKIFFSKEPDNLPDREGNFQYDNKDNRNYYYGAARTFSWESQTLSQFDFSFEREESLEYEVLSFFKSLQDRLGSLLTGPEGLAVILIVAALTASVIYANHMRKK